MLVAEGLKELSDIKSDDKEIEYRFGAELEFGTAGMRGIMGFGTNMMNIYNVRRATMGLAKYILSEGAEFSARGVVISYDTRKNSELFAREAAGVLARNGIFVYLYTQPHPVPMLSYAIRKLKAAAGIMITASHNPKEYNGYKVYGEDGAQMSPESTDKVVKFIDEITDYFSVQSDAVKDSVTGRRHPFVKFIGKRVDKSYYRKIKKLSLSRKSVRREGKTLKLVYTPLHGSGYIPVMTILGKLGIKVTPVEEQVVKDENFSTVTVPNPELYDSLKMGIALADKIKADVVFGTDPDCDRLGVAIRDDKGEFLQLSGNQVGILLLDYILTRLKESGQMPKNGVVIKSFVSTSMAKAIAEDFGVELVETPVGFKFIGEKIKEYEKDNSKTFIFGFEESCGYLVGTNSRDKDAVVASMMFAEMVCYYTDKGKGVFERLCEIYDKYGYVLDKNNSITFGGLSAMSDMNKVVDSLKTKKIEKLDIYDVIAVRDYSSSKRIAADGTVSELKIEKSNCIYYELENGSFVCIRPSGTEPKLKIYYSIRAKGREQAIKAQEKVSESFEKYIK